MELCLDAKRKQGACRRRRWGHKRSVGVQSYEPHDVSAHRGENEGYLRDVEKSEEQNSIRQEAAPDDELSMPPEVQEGVRPPAGCLRLPNRQKLLRTSSGQTMPLESGHEKAYDGSENKQPAPYQIAFRA